VAIAMAILGNGGAALAQDAAPAPPEEAAQAGQQEIFVTAQRRAQNLQDVPIAVSTFTEEALDLAGVATTDMLLAVSPGVTIQRQLAGATPFIRGIGTQTVAPGIESAVADLAGQITRQGDGYGRNLLTGADVNFRREAGLRSRILWKPADELRITLSADYSKLESSLGFILQPIPGTLSAIGQPAGGTRFDSQANFPQSNDTEYYGGSVRIEYDFGPVQLTSLSAYRRLDVTLNFDQDSTPARIVDVIVFQADRTFQQEFLLQGRAGRLNYTAGLFYFNSTSGYVPLTIRSVVPSLNFDLYSDLDTDSYAAFAQADFDLSDMTTITAGARYTSDGRDYTAARFPAGANPSNPANATASAAAARTFSKLTWRLAILQRLSEDVNIYASYSRGFKSGVFNTSSVSTAAIQPETIDAFEAGLRSEALNNALRFNVSAFYYEYSNIQLNRIENGAAILLNAAKGRLYGGEIETSYVAQLGSGELTLSANLSYLNARYTSFPNGPVFTPTGVGGNAQSVRDLSGNEMIHAPEFTISFGGSYIAPIGNGMELQLSANYFHSASFFWEPENNVRQPSYDLLSAQAAISFADGRFRLRVFGRNLTDSFYYAYVSSNTLGNLGGPADPRTYGIGLDVRF